VDKTPTGANVTTRLKNSFKFRHSSEITKRDSRILVTRFELELAITKDIRHKLVSFINSKSINLNARDYYGKTLLHTACSVGNYQCAQILINAGAKVGIQDQAGFTPLHCAVVANHVPCAAVMIAAGADVMTSTRTMHTALTLAHEEEMILLVGRSLLLRGTQRKTVKDDNKCFSLRETKL
jgi:ankyrin repeat protein